MELEGARVLVVGASSGIGREVAVQLGVAGARVVVAARRADRLSEVIAAVGGDTASVGCDVRDPAQCDAVVTGAVEHLGGLDAVVYATAVDPLVRLVDT